MKSIKWCAVVACALLASVASAQDQDPVDRAEDRVDSAEDRVDRAEDRADRAAREMDRADRGERRDNRPRALEDRVGLGLTLGGGAQTFLDNEVNDITSAAGNWDARLIVGTRNFIAGEVAYLGTAQGLNTLGVEDNAMLVSNGFEGAFRVNFLRGDWQPYVLAGYTWRRYSVTNTAVNTSSVRENANVSEIPVAAGLSYRFRGLLADVRLGLHNAFSNSLIPDQNLSAFSGEAKVGFEF